MGVARKMRELVAKIPTDTLKITKNNDGSVTIALVMFGAVRTETTTTYFGFSEDQAKAEFVGKFFDDLDD